MMVLRYLMTSRNLYIIFEPQITKFQADALPRELSRLYSIEKLPWLEGDSKGEGGGGNLAVISCHIVPSLTHVKRETY